MPMGPPMIVNTPRPRPGAGLGLNIGAADPKKRAGFREAANTGKLGEFLTAHPGLQQRFDARLAGGGPFQAKAQRYADTNQLAGGMRAGAAGLPAGGLPTSLPPSGGGAPGPPGATAPPGDAPPFTTIDFLNKEYGVGSGLGPQGNYSDPNNPIYQAEIRNYQRQLAQQRARFGSMGMGNSSREALMEGEATGELGARLAQTGEQSRQNDLNRMVQAILGGRGADLAANAQQMSGGQAVTNIGASEQQLPGLAAFMNLLALFNQTQGTGTFSSEGDTKSGFRAG